MKIKGNIKATQANGFNMPVLGNEEFFKLIGIAHRFNADNYSFTATGVTRDDEELGDWKIVITKINKEASNG